MKFLGTDFKRKYIIAKINNEDIIVSFYDSFWKGIYDIEIFTGKQKISVNIESAYPGFNRRMQEAALLVKMRLKHTVNRVSKRCR